MEKHVVKINKIILEKNLFKIETDTKLFISKIIKGSVNFTIINENGDEISLQNVEENKIVTIYGENNNNNIVIRKLVVKMEYAFIDSSSESEGDIDFI